MNIEESIHVSFDESNVISPRKDVLDDVSNFLEEMHTHERDSKRKRDESNKDSQDYETKANNDLPKEWKASRNHPLDNIFSNIAKKVTFELSQSFDSVKFYYCG